MAAMCVNDIKEIPGYKVILNAVLKAQILQLIDQLAVETSEESVLITANLSDGTLGHLGSNFGNIFLNTYADVKQQFLGFCLHEYQNTLNKCTLPESDVSTSPEKKSPGGKSPKGPRKRKKATVYTRKSKKTAYQNQPPELETLKSIDEAALANINQQIAGCPPLQLNTEVENLNNNCTDFTPEISNVSGNVKHFDTENDKTYVKEVNKSEETDAQVGDDIKDKDTDNREIPENNETREKTPDTEIGVSMETSISGESSELIDKNSKCDVVQDTNKVSPTDNKSKTPRKGKSVKPVSKKGRRGRKKVTKKAKDKGSDTDTTIEWSEFPDSPDIPNLDKSSAKNIKKEPEDFTNEPPDIVSNTHNDMEQQDGPQTKHVIVTKHTTYDSAEDDDDDVGEQSKKTKKSLQTLDNKSSAIDSKDGEMCSKDESVKDNSIEEENKDIPKEEEKKEGTANKKKGKIVKKKGKRGRKPGFKVAAKVVKEGNEETKSESVDVLKVCNQTMDQITDSVARAISEERKERLALLDIHSAGLDSVGNQEISKGSEGNGNIKTDSKSLSENSSVKKDDASHPVKTDIGNGNDTSADELKDKSIKVLAIWNEIVKDTKEASKEELCDLISDKINQNQEKMLIGKDCSKGEINNDVNSANELKSVQKEKSVVKSSSVDNDSQEKKLKSNECSGGQIKDNLVTSAASTSNPNSRQGSCEKQTVTPGNQAMTKSGSEAVDVNVSAKKDNPNQGIPPNVKDVDAKAKQPTKSSATITQSTTNTIRSSSTPVKQIGTKIGQSTPKQVKTPTQSVNKQKIQSFTPGKGKSLVDNLISTGVPIIIPDDDDDDLNDVEEAQDEFIPNPRSNAFEIKSKQYREQQEHRSAKRISQTAQRQGYSAYMSQASSQRSAVSATAYSQYPTHLQQQQQTQQYQYQGYQETQQFRNQQYQQQYQYDEYIDQQQYETQPQMYSPQQPAPASRQQLFTPPKSSTHQRGRPQKSASYQGREMSPQSHNFSPPTTPTLPKSSPYFKQSYITPTKHQQNISSQSPQSRMAPNQSPTSRQSLQHNRFPSAPKPNIPIVIDDEPSRMVRKGQASVSNAQYQQSMHRDPYVAKSPVTNPQQFQPGQAHEVTTNYEEFLRLQQQQQQQKQQHVLQQQLQYEPGLENRQLNPVSVSISDVSNVSGMHVPTRENLIGSQMHQGQYKQSPVSAGADPSLIRQSNERTPIKRMRSEETVLSPVMTVGEPTNKRRHTSTDSNASLSRISNSKSPVTFPETSQGLPEGQISPSKIPPKLEIDVDDVRGTLPALPEFSGQQGSRKSPSMSSLTSDMSTSDREEKASIPLNLQLARSDLKSFSPPVSPSTKRLHSAPGSRASGMTAHSSGDDSSVTSQETAPSQPLKKFGCGDCGKSYTTKAALNQHFRKHTQERPFECDVCGKHYSQKGYLKKHILTHFEEK